MEAKSDEPFVSATLLTIDLSLHGNCWLFFWPIANGNHVNFCQAPLTVDPEKRIFTYL